MIITSSLHQKAHRNHDASILSAQPPLVHLHVQFELPLPFGRIYATNSDRESPTPRTQAPCISNPRRKSFPRGHRIIPNLTTDRDRCVTSTHHLGIPPLEQSRRTSESITRGSLSPLALPPGWSTHLHAPDVIYRPLTLLFLSSVPGECSWPGDPIAIGRFVSGRYSNFDRVN